MNNSELFDKNIFLLYTDQIHFQLIGCFYNGMMQTLFNNNNIPKILKDIIN